MGVATPYQYKVIADRIGGKYKVGMQKSLAVVI